MIEPEICSERLLNTTAMAVKNDNPALTTAASPLKRKKTFSDI
jgi:hypothetical protein